MVPLRPEPVEQRLRVRLRARDVAVAVAEPRGLSMHNALPATVREITPAPGTAHEVPLALAPGRPVWALVKSVAFDHGPAP